jgi:hypothetical protein
LLPFEAFHLLKAFDRLFTLFSLPSSLILIDGFIIFNPKGALAEDKRLPMQKYQRF